MKYQVLTKIINENKLNFLRSVFSTHTIGANQFYKAVCFIYNIRLNKTQKQIYSKYKKNKGYLQTLMSKYLPNL